MKINNELPILLVKPEWSICVSGLKRRSLQFGVSIVWKEAKSNHDGSYFCMVKIQAINRNNRKKWTNPDLEPASWPIPHSAKVPVPAFDHQPELTESSGKSSSHVDEQCLVAVKVSERA